MHQQLQQIKKRETGLLKSKKKEKEENLQYQKMTIFHETENMKKHTRKKGQAPLQEIEPELQRMKNEITSI